MKARQYDRRFFTRGIQPHVYAIRESNDINRDHLKYMGDNIQDKAEWQQDYDELCYIVDFFRDAKEYGSILNPERHVDYRRLYEFRGNYLSSSINIETMGMGDTADALFGLIEQYAVFAQKYDVVVTNPPYMGSSGMSTKLSQYVIKKYPKTKSDLSTVFMERALCLCKQDGIMSMINIPVWMFLISFESQREDLVSTNTFSTLLHFGRGIFGADFGTVAFSIRKSHTSSYYSLYMRLFDKPSSVDSLEQKESWFFARKGLYTIQQENFSKIAGTPIAYWVSTAMLKAFTAFPSLGRVSEPKQGLITGDNDRFLREWYEVAKRKLISNGLFTTRGRLSKMVW
jgi:hypothetical protein